MNQSAIIAIFYSLAAILLIAGGFIILLYYRKQTGNMLQSHISVAKDALNGKYAGVNVEEQGLSSKNFETNVPGIFIAGEIAGMGLIETATEQARKAVEYISMSVERGHSADFDLVIVGAGPAGISASLAARKNDLRFILLEQDTLGSALYNYPGDRIMMSSPMDLALEGKKIFKKTVKSDLLDFWRDLILKYHIPLQENCKVESVIKLKNFISVLSSEGQNYTTASVLLAIGLRGSPGKPGIPGEDLPKVAYRLNKESEEIRGRKILVIGGGDQAIEAALQFSEKNHVTVSYRKENFSRIKPATSKMLEKALLSGKIEILF